MATDVKGGTMAAADMTGTAVFMSDPPQMNPAVAATGSSGIAGALVVLLNALLHFIWNMTPDPNVVAAEVVVATAMAGTCAHYLTRPTQIPLPEAPPVPLAAQL